VRERQEVQEVSRGSGLTHRQPGIALPGRTSRTRSEAVRERPWSETDWERRACAPGLEQSVRPGSILVG
jgi:hypothetical protein